MFLVGIGPGQGAGNTLAFVYQKRFKNVRHHYRLLEAARLPYGLETGDAVSPLVEIYRREDLAETKKIFSQDGRPARMIPAGPRLIVNCTGTGEDTAGALRKAGVPVERFFIRPHAGWEKDALGKALGDDYRVGVPDLMETMVAVRRQRRMEVADHVKDAVGTCGFLETIDALKEACAGPRAPACRDPLLTLCLPVWFREKIRYSRPYRV